MSKSILVIDKPKSCQLCKLCGFGIYDEEPHCKFIGTLHKYDFMDMVSPKCPLQDTTELLEALHSFIEECYDREDEYGLDVEMVNSAEQLYKALGGIE